MVARTYRTEGIVLRSFPTGEGGLIVAFLQSDGAKLRAMAWGARKLTSRKIGHLEPLTRVEASFSKGRGMDNLTQVQSVEAFNDIKKDLVATARALYYVELVDAFAVEEYANPPLYKLFHSALRDLVNDQDLNIAMAHFQWHLLRICGFMPELYICVECQQMIAPCNHLFSIELGGVLCSKCGSVRSSSICLSLPALKVLRYLHRSSAFTPLSLQLSGALKRQLIDILDNSVRHWADREIRSKRFMDEVGSELAEV